MGPPLYLAVGRRTGVARTDERVAPPIEQPALAGSRIAAIRVCANQCVPPAACTQCQPVCSRVPDVDDIETLAGDQRSQAARVPPIAPGSDAACRLEHERGRDTAGSCLSQHSALTRRGVRTAEFDLVPALAQRIARNAHRLCGTGPFPIAREVEDFQALSARRALSQSFAYFKKT